MGIRKDFMVTPDNMNAYQRRRAITAYRAALDAGDPDPLGFVAQMFQESRFDPAARSSAGASGEAQFMPATAKRFGVDTTDPDSSLRGAIAYRRYIRNYLGKRGLHGEEYVLAGYNAGEGNAARALRNFKETRTYVDRIAKSRGVFASIVGGDDTVQPPQLHDAAAPAPLPPYIASPQNLPSEPVPAVTPRLQNVVTNQEPPTSTLTPIKSYTDSLWRRVLGA